MGEILAADGAALVWADLLAVNNTWGRGALVAGLDYRQSMALGPDGVLFEWDWPRVSPRRVLAYPSLIAGRSPWREGPAHPLLPMPLETAMQGLAVAFDGARGGEGFQVALDLWIAEGPSPTPDATRHEVMVWLSSGEGRPAGVPVAEVRIDDAAWTLWLKDAPHGRGWRYAAFVAAEERLSGRLDLAALLGALDARRPFEPGLWLVAVEIGAEITGGAGWWRANAFDVTAGP